MKRKKMMFFSNLCNVKCKVQKKKMFFSNLCNVK